MKLAILAALAAAISFAQTPAPAKTVVKTKALTPEDGYHFGQINSDRRTIEAQKERAVLPLDIEQNQLVTKVCAAIGVPKDKIATQCVVDPDKSKGKGFGEVRWEKPADKKN